QLLILECFSRVEHHRMPSGIDSDHAVLAEQLYVVLLIPSCRPDIPPGEVLLGAQVRLRQRRTAEGDSRLAADEHDSASEALFAKGNCGVSPGEAAADDDDRLASVFYGHRSQLQLALRSSRHLKKAECSPRLPEPSGRRAA